MYIYIYMCIAIAARARESLPGSIRAMAHKRLEAPSAWFESPAVDWQTACLSSGSPRVNPTAGRLGFNPGLTQTSFRRLAKRVSFLSSGGLRAREKGGSCSSSPPVSISVLWMGAAAGAPWICVRLRYMCGREQRARPASSEQRLWSMPVRTRSTLNANAPLSFLAGRSGSWGRASAGVGAVGARVACWLK